MKVPVGCAIALDCTVVSSATVSTLSRLITRPRQAASMLCASSHSQPASPMRWRQRTKLDASQDRSCWKYRSQLKCCQYGFSLQRAMVSSLLSA